MKPVSYSDSNLIEPLKSALAKLGYETPTPIQAQAIPQLLEGRDLLGCAQTGTGKTAAFALPMLQSLAMSPKPPAKRAARALVLAPTRELAQQIHDSFRAYGRFLRLSTAVIYGGVGATPQIRAMNRGVDILVATPGRLLDLMGQGHVRLERLSIFVLDEADRMLDMGFLPDIKRVVKALPAERQTLLFSATMPDNIAQLADSLLKNPVKVSVTPESPTVDLIEQKVLFVDHCNKRALLAEMLEDREVKRALVFTRTKHGADRLAKQLSNTRVTAESIHGNKSQGARQAALAKFKKGGARVLVATDIAARGIDVAEVTHVFNFDLPNEPEAYVHRIGRTGRAGAQGVAISFCDATERGCLRGIERLIKQRVPVQEEHSFPSHSLPPAPKGPSRGGRKFKPRGRRFAAA